MKNNRVKMTAMIVLVMLFSIGLLMLISYQRASTSMSDQLEANYSVTADKYAQELTAWVNTKATIIDTMAAEIAVSGIYNSDAADFHDFLSESCLALDINGDVYDIYFTYPDNRMVCASDYISDGSVDYTHERDWFTEAAGTGEMFYSTPYRDSDTGKPVITISKAIYKNHTLQGVLAADIFVDVLVNIISQAKVAADSYAFLVDQNLGMIVHPNEAYSFDDVPHGVMEIPGAPYEEMVSKIRSNSDETVYLEDYDGVTRAFVVSRMSNTGWFVGVATSKAILLKGMRSMVWGFLIAAVLAAASGGVIAVFLAYVLDRQERQRQEFEAKVKKLEKQVADSSARAAGRFLSEASSKDAAADPEAPFGDQAGDSAGSGKKERISRINLRIPILIILFLMICMVVYTTRAINSAAVANIREVGEDRISASAAQLENYLEAAKSSLWVTADTVDLMIRNGVSNREILDYLTQEAQNQKKELDVNFNGLYGCFRGEYLDSQDWVPPENYDPARRDWYLSAVEAGGEAVIVPPYVDAQTDSIIISISRMLSSGNDVLSLDIMMDHIQEIVSTMKIKEKGYGFVVDQDGMLIAHQNESLKGHSLAEDEAMLPVLDGILDTQNGSFEVTTDQGKQTVFVRQIMDQWYVAIVIGNGELLAEVYRQLVVNVLICTIIFALILFFYILGRRNEQNYSRRIEEMRDEEQKQAYEARALKLEKKAADQANKAKSDFLADMSHEIRTPINAVLGMNEMILRESLQARSMETIGTESSRDAFNNIITYAQNIESAGSNLLAIINDILDFSKIEARKMELVEGNYHLSSVLNDLSNMIFFKAQEKGLDFLVDVDETLPDELYGDEVRVRQVITNILNNAVKYTDHGSVKLTLRGDVQRPAEPGQSILLRIDVQDTGIGIHKEDIERLFAKFQRLDLKQNSTVEGTGLGLVITRRLLDMMGGSIEVQSEYDRGSVFTLLIPQKIVSVYQVGDFQTRFQTYVKESKAYRETFQAPEARVLIVDDTKMNLTVVIGLLKNTRMQLETAAGGEEAVTLAQTNAYDLILMDQRMPEMDGTEALHLIRAQSDGANHETPVICLTADAVTGAKERYLAEGFTDYLTKPIDSIALEQMLIKYLPEEKVLVRQEEQEAGGTWQDAGGGKESPFKDPAGDPFAALETAGIDTQAGLRYCRDDRNMYEALLQEYVRGAAEKTHALEQSYAAQDWKNYSVYVHSLKSTSRMIGAAELSETAAKLEAAADHAQADLILSGHENMMNLYLSLVEAVRQVTGTEDGSLTGEADDEILEFLPE